MKNFTVDNIKELIEEPIDGAEQVPWVVFVLVMSDESWNGDEVVHRRNQIRL
jgi:hypothetical protein